MLDFKNGEPVAGEMKESFERRVRCLVNTITTPGTNDSFIHVYQTSTGPVGVLKNRAIYTLESGDSDLDTLAIKAFMDTPVITGGNQVVHRKKQWDEYSIRGVPNAADTMSIDLKTDWNTSVASTESRLMTADTGNIFKITRNSKQRSEAVQFRFRNATVDETFVVSSFVLKYSIGAEIRAS